MTAAPAQNVCIVCGTDVANKARVKDAKGNYVCAVGCQQKLAEQQKTAATKARAAAPEVVVVARSEAPVNAGMPRAQGRPTVKTPAVMNDDGGVMDRLLGASPVLNGRPCPSCKTPMHNDHVICLTCGYNAGTGQAIKTKVLKAPKESKVKPAKGSGRRWANENGPPFWKFFLVYSAAMSALSLLVFAGPAGVLIAWALLALSGLAALILCIVSAFKNDQTVFGVLGLLNIVPVLNLIGFVGMVIFNLFYNEDNASRALYWGTLVGGIVLGVMLGLAQAMGMNVDLSSTTLSPLGK